MTTPENQNSIKNNIEKIEAPKVTPENLEPKEISNEDFMDYTKNEGVAFKNETAEEMKKSNSVLLDEETFEKIKNETGVEDELAEIDKESEKVIAESQQEANQDTKTPFELVKDNLIKNVELARASALPLERVKETEQKINDLEKLYFNGKTLEEKFKQEISHLYIEHNSRGVVAFNTLPEFQEALKMCDIDDKTIKSVLAHENAHSSMAEQLEVENNYKIRFVKLPDGRTGFIPSVEYGYPLGATAEEKKEISQKIINAPETLSHRDKHKLGMEVSKDEPDIFD